MKHWRKLAFGALRLALAVWLVQALTHDLPAHRARAAYAALPGYDYTSEARRLWHDSRYGEAVMVLDASLADASPQKARRLKALRSRVLADQNSFRRRLEQLGRGALRGRGDTPASLAGAMVTDLFVIGDVRDLAIQIARFVRGEKTDKVLAALSAVGLLTTFSPQEVGVDVLKALRKSGALAGGLLDSLTRMARRAAAGGDYAKLRRVARDTSRLNERLGPAATIHIVKDVDNPAALSRAAHFVARAPKEGGFALWLYGRPALKWLGREGPGGDKALLKASRKGRRGMRWLRRYGQRALKPHPLVGLAKAVYKGNLPKLFSRLLERYDLVLLAAGAGWAMLELVFLWRRVLRILPEK